MSAASEAIKGSAGGHPTPLETLAPLRPAGADGALDAHRDRAWAAFCEQGLPTRRLEAWKGTSLAPLAKLAFARVGPPSEAETTGPSEAETTGLGRSVVATLPGPCLVFVDGRFDAGRSRLEGLAEGVEIEPLREALARAPEQTLGRLGRLADGKRAALVALQDAFLEDGALIRIAPGKDAGAPIGICLLTTGEPGADEQVGEARATASFPRLLLEAGAGSRASLIQEHVGTTPENEHVPGLTAFVAEHHLAPGARVEAIELQREAPGRVHFTSVHARLERDAHLDSRVFSIGQGLVRSELSIELAEPGAEIAMRGFFLGRDESHVDHFTTVDHAAPHCTSDEEYRGVLGDRSDGVFRGRVIVRPGAQKTDARQSNPNLLLSDRASIDTKPQLEIYADDVRASHGATIGQLDADALFFLRARGIGEQEARLMLTRAFARSVVDGIVCETTRGAVGECVVAALATLESHTADAASHDHEGGPA